MDSMQFFNDVLFCAGESYVAYERYWSANREHLPDCLLRINGGMLPEACFASRSDVICLHDARIRSVDVDLPNVILRLDCDHHGSLREVALHYFGVPAFSPVPDILLADVPDSDLMCHETTVNEVRQFNHRMLFASSDIISVDFTRLKLEVSDHPFAERQR